MPAGRQPYPTRPRPDPDPDPDPDNGFLDSLLDVTDPEPLPEGHPLWSAPGLLLTPHVAGAVPQGSGRAVRAVTDQLARVVAGEPVVDVVGDY